MKNFIKKVWLFVFPIILAAIILEMVLRIIPNDYKLKADYLDRNSDNVEILFLGSSHAYYDLNPDEISEPGFNAAYVIQTLDYDYAILKKYDGHWKNLKVIVIPVSYFSLFTMLKDTPEAWRVKNYILYEGINMPSDTFTDYFEVFNNRSEGNIVKIKSFLLKEPTTNSSALGWRLPVPSQAEFTDDGRSAARRHVEFSEGKSIDHGLELVRAIIQFAIQKNVKVVFFTPPAYSTYIENLDQEHLNLITSAMEAVDKQYTNVVYRDYLRDPEFSKEDFVNSDHLNAKGARILTKKIEDLYLSDVFK